MRQYSESVDLHSISLPLEPLGDYVVLKRLEAAATGIVVPEGARQISNRAVVLAVGPGVIDPAGTRTPVSLEAGDEVLVSPRVGTDVRIGSVVVTLVRADDIFGRWDAS